MNACSSIAVGSESYQKSGHRDQHHGTVHNRLSLTNADGTCNRKGGVGALQIAAAKKYASFNPCDDLRNLTCSYSTSLHSKHRKNFIDLEGNIGGQALYEVC